MTEPIDFGLQAPALAFIARLAVLHPTLPAPNVSFSGIFPNRVNLCLDGPIDIEAWREALQVPAEDVDCSARPDDQTRIGFDAKVNGVEFHAFAHFAAKQEGAAA